MPGTMTYSREGQEIRTFPPTMFGGPITQPAVGATVVVSVSDTTPFRVGMPVVVPGGGIYQVTAKTTTTLTLLNLGVWWNTQPAAPIVVAGSPIWPGSLGGGLEAGTGLLAAGTSGPIANAAGAANSIYDIQFDTLTNAGFISVTAGAGTFQVDSSNVLDARPFRWTRLT